MLGSSAVRRFAHHLPHPEGSIRDYVYHPQILGLLAIPAEGSSLDGELAPSQPPEDLIKDLIRETRRLAVGHRIGNVIAAVEIPRVPPRSLDRTAGCAAFVLDFSAMPDEYN
ncbi:hypothetical protein RG836_02545 [Pseudomonas sp. SZMC_28357]|uniref:hypothetical protein n=1 Tax=Pseudomonas sp. SZMC_28357 TaxID=3074380 RepID=UPI0028711B2E|nr:hypothetical protein [Pseudomonas sp. SZMC_28357]MDR9750313.1 hypothetical protein [Pseudomonas sp. SZMC_28357]